MEHVNANEKPTAHDRAVEADAYLNGALEHLSDLMCAVYDLTRTDGKRGFTIEGNREAAIRHCLDVLACVRSAQQELRDVLGELRPALEAARKPPESCSRCAEDFAAYMMAKEDGAPRG